MEVPKAGLLTDVRMPHRDLLAAAQLCPASRPTVPSLSMRLTDDDGVDQAMPSIQPAANSSTLLLRAGICETLALPRQGTLTYAAKGA